jgi:adenosylcobinamide-phosphate synthase
VIEPCRPFAPDPTLLLVAVAADLAAGDPVYAAHPIRLIGGLLRWFEHRLRTAGLDGYGGGLLLFVGLTAASLSVLALLIAGAHAVSPAVSWICHACVLYSLLALGDLVRHVWRIEAAARFDDVAGSRRAVSALVGRDTDRMDIAACRRAGVESLSESLTDGFVSPIFWYVVAGLPGILVFKVVSTMDSMVGYKTPQYLRFGWCGARLDDAMNYLPARLTWLAIAAIAAVLPRFSGGKAWTIGLRQHALLLGPNAGWSEAATAGALERRIAGPIWLNGVQVTDIWIGDPGDPVLASAGDVKRALILVVTTGVATAVLGSVLMWRLAAW